MSNPKIINDLKEILNCSKPKIICKMNNSCRDEACHCLNLAKQILISECEIKKLSLKNLLQRKNWKLSCDSFELKEVLSDVFETCEVRLSEFPEPQIDVEEFVDHLYTNIDQTLESFCKTEDLEIPTFIEDVGRADENVQKIDTKNKELAECEIALKRSQGHQNLNVENSDILDSPSFQNIGNLERGFSHDKCCRLDEKLEIQNNDEQNFSCGSEIDQNVRVQADDVKSVENFIPPASEEVIPEEVNGFRDEHHSFIKINKNEEIEMRVMLLGRQTYKQREANLLEHLKIKKARADAAKQNLDAVIRNRCIRIATEREKRQKQAAQRRQQAEEERIRRIMTRNKTNPYQLEGFP